MFQLYLALIFLSGTAVSGVLLGARNLRNTLLLKSVTEAVQTEDAMMFPLKGSVFLFSCYVFLRFIPKEYFSALISFFLIILSVFQLSELIKVYTKPTLLTGTFCIACGIVYIWTKHWVLNNIFAFALAVTSLESIPVNTFNTSFILLIGLFFYDIFWVFGTDVMVVVATGIDAPIKLTFPRTIFGDHSNMSMLGLGDLVVPGLFISQTLIFSQHTAKRGNLYFYVALVAYTLSLINTMGVMIIFQHAQPALLFIVPWLLITFCATVVYQGDLHKALEFDILTAIPSTKEIINVPTEEDSFLSFVFRIFLGMFRPDEVAESQTAAGKQVIDVKKDS